MPPSKARLPALGLAAALVACASREPRRANDAHADVDIRWTYRDGGLVLEVQGASRVGDDEPYVIEPFQSCRSVDLAPGQVAAVACIVDEHSTQRVTITRTASTTLEAITVVEGAHGERLADGPAAIFTIDPHARVIAHPLPPNGR